MKSFWKRTFLLLICLREKGRCKVNDFVSFLKKNKIIFALLIIVVIVGIGGISYLFLGNESLNIGKRALTPTSPEQADYTSKPYERKSYEGKPVQTTTQPAPYTVGSTGETQFGLKVIKNGSMTLRAEKGKFFEVWKKIIFTAKSLSGFTSSSNYYKQDDYYYGTISVMIPSKDFDVFTGELAKAGKIENMHVSTKNVTGEYVDLSSRIKVLESQRKLLLSWLDNAKDVKDMLSLRNELENVETKIEQTKGRMNYIAFHTDFSEITISISEEGKIKHRRSEVALRIVQGWQRALNGLVSSFIGLIIFIGWMIPWLIIIYIVYLIYKKRKKEASR